MAFVAAVLEEEEEEDDDDVDNDDRVDDPVELDTDDID